MSTYKLVRASILALGGMALAFLGATLAISSPPTPYQMQHLASDGSVPTESVDPNLRNPWGLAASPTGPWWISAHAVDLSVVYDGQGVAQPLIVDVPGGPTGVVYNTGTGFVIGDGVGSAPAQVLFASQEGLISGWRPELPDSTQALVAVDNSAAGVIYTGLAMATTVSGDRLYAADFRNAKIDVLDGTFHPVLAPGAFVDPTMQRGFAPFGIQNVNGRILVTYARQSDDGTREVPGMGLGFVSVFDTEGAFLARVATRGLLNAPWGVAMAPASFGTNGGQLLVANTGDGKILAFEASDDLMSSRPAGVLRDQAHKPIEIDGLRGIAFGNGQLSGALDALYFTAGPSQGQGGSFGRIAVAP